MKDAITAGASTHGVIVCAEKIAFLARVVKWAAEHDSEDAALLAATDIAKEMPRFGECVVHMLTSVTDVDVATATAVLANRKAANDPPGS